MKFAHSLQFNSVPEWTSKYIDYEHLKKNIYELQKQFLYDGEPEDRNIYLTIFQDALEQQAFKIEKFFKSQETGLLANYHQLKDDIKDYQDTSQQLAGSLMATRSNRVNRRRSSGSSTGSLAISNDDESIQAPLLLSQTQTTGSYQSLESMDHMPLNPMLQEKLTLKKRLVQIYTQLSELRDFIELNFTGFSKICKKFDKSLNTHLKASYLEHLRNDTHIFNSRTLSELCNCIEETIVTYAKLSSNILPVTYTENSNHVVGNLNDNESDLETSKNLENLVQAAKNELNSHLRDHVVWERNTVWKDMMNMERKSQSVKVHNIGTSREKKEDLEITQYSTLATQTFKDLNWRLAGKWLITRVQFWRFLVFSLLFAFLLNHSVFDDISQRSCFAILVYVSLLWATETIPLFVTSLLTPLLIVTLPVLKDSETSEILSARDSSQYILSTMWSSVIMLLLGGFTLAAALSKYNIAKVLSTHILSSAGTNPKLILLTIMCVAWFISMWVSNVAAPVLCYSIIQPLLRNLPRESSYTKGLILGVALASNIGGMASPISSPQNIFALGLMDPSPSWTEWFMITIPVCSICIFTIWVLLMLTFPLDSKIKILRFHAINDPFTIKQWFVVSVSVGTIILWCLAKELTGIFGEVGIISIIPLVIFFGTGLLTSDDFNNFMWTIVILAMGGTTLGKAVSSSGLLTEVATFIKNRIEHEPIFVIVLIFGLVILFMATFVSHTVAAMIILPLMQEIGSNLPSGDHSRLLIMLATLLCSGAMGLPTSGFPNVTAISMIDETGERYLNVATFITRGIPSSLISYLVIVTLGYGLMVLIGF